jgi:hypothetical protein
MSASKIYIDPTEDIVFTVSKINHAPANKVVLIVPAASNIISSQVSMKLLARMLSTSDKLVVLVTEDEIGHKFAANSGLVSKEKVSEVESDDWQTAAEYKRKLQEMRNQKRAELVDQISKQDYEIVDRPKAQKQEITIADEAEKQSKKENPVADLQTKSQESTKSDEEIKPLFKKLEPKLIDLGEFAILSGGDISEEERAIQLREKLLEINEKKIKVEEPSETDPDDEGSAPEGGEGEVVEDSSSEKLTVASADIDPKKKEEKSSQNQNLDAKVEEDKQQISPPSRLKKRSKQPGAIMGRDISSSNFTEERRAPKTRKVLTNHNFAKGYSRLRQSERTVPQRTARQSRSSRVGARGGESSASGAIENFVNRIKQFATDNFSSASRNRMLAIGGAVALLIVFLFFSLSSPTTTVSLNVDRQSIPVNQRVTAVEGINAVDTQTLQVPMRVIAKEDSRSESGDATGTGEAGERARGSVTIFNFKNEAVSLPAGTTLVSVNNNLEYTLTQDANVPASDKRDSVPIQAKDFGEEYNLSSGKKDFSIQGSDLGDVSVFTYSGVSGGTSEEVSVVTQQDIDGLKEELTNVIRQSLTTDINALISASEIKLSDEISFGEPQIETTHNAGDQTDSFDITVSMSAEMRVIDKKHLEEIALELVRQNASITGELRVEELQDPTISALQIEGDTVSFDLIASANVSAAITEADVRGRIQGLSVSSAEDELRNLQDVQSVQLDYSPSYYPPFLKKVPDNEERVQIIINETAP